MDKNNIDIDFDFEEEYGFDPNDLLDEEDDFDFSEFFDEDLDSEQDAGEDSPSDGNAPAGFDNLDSADNAEESDAFASAPPEEQQPVYAAAVSDDTRVFRREEGGFLGASAEDQPEEPLSDQELPEEEMPEEGVPEDMPEEDPTEEDPTEKKPRRRNKKLTLPKRNKSSNQEKRERREKSAKKSVFSKLLDIYMEPVTKMQNEPEAVDPLDPKYTRRKARQKKRIFKEVYLPGIIAGVALFLILSFIVGAASNWITTQKNLDAAAKIEAQDKVSAAAKAELEYKRVVAQAEQLAICYDYDKAIDLLDEYSGKGGPYEQQIIAKKAALLNERDQLLEWKDVSAIPNLSFHVLMADASRACNKDVSGAELCGSYNKNFVSVQEFRRILDQLYAANFVLVDFNSFISSNTGVDGNESFFTQSMYLPKGKKPVMITETMVNYFEYMVDPDKDGVLDGSGHGFANKLVLDSNGEIKAAYVDADGNNLVGNYDLVPVLEAFIQEHPDFSYRGARAILAVTGSEGVFGYRTNTSYVSRFGQAFYDDEVAEAKKVVAALREKGYTIASYTYSNQAYKGMSTVQIQAEVQNWNNQITPVLGNVDTIVFARGSDIDAYSGTTFNVLYNSGLRFFLNSGSSPRVEANTTFIRQTRLMVTGEAMAWYSSQFSEYFDSNVVLDLAARGNYPVKS